MAVYCNQCGTGNPDGSEFCARCGAAVMQAPLIGELVLPDWLTRAAAESVDPAPVSTRMRTVETGDRALSVQPGPIPSGDLSSAIPNWLKGTPSVIAEPRAEESLLTDLTDTRSFISEDDLPAWIRQIAVADAEHKAEAERQAAAAEIAEPEPLVEAPAAPKRRLLPGEVEAVRGAANPWLARGERTPVEVAAAIAEPAPERPAPPEPVAVPRKETTASEAKTSRAMPSLGSVNPRYLLIGAIAIVVAILILTMVL